MLELLLLPLLFVLLGLAAEELEVLFTVLIMFLVKLVGEENAMLASFYPWGFWHGCIDLLQVEL